MAFSLRFNSPTSEGTPRYGIAKVKQASPPLALFFFFSYPLLFCFCPLSSAQFAFRSEQARRSWPIPFFGLGA